jgi:hypothetical protein
VGTGKTIKENKSKLTYIKALQEFGLSNILGVSPDFFKFNTKSNMLKPYQCHREANTVIDLRLSNRLMQKKIIKIADMLEVKVKVNFEL